MRCSSSEMMENLFFKASKDLVQLEHCFSSPGIQPTCLPCPWLILAGPLAGARLPPRCQHLGHLQGPCTAAHLASPTATLL